MKKQLVRVALFILLVVASAIVGKMIGGTTEREDPRAVIPVPFDTSGSQNDSPANPNQN